MPCVTNLLAGSLVKSWRWCWYLSQKLGLSWTRKSWKRFFVSMINLSHKFIRLQHLSKCTYFFPEIWIQIIRICCSYLLDNRSTCYAKCFTSMIFNFVTSTSAAHSISLTNILLSISYLTISNAGQDFYSLVIIHLEVKYNLSKIQFLFSTEESIHIEL